MTFYALEKLINLYDGYRNVFSVVGKSLLLIQEDGRRYLLENACPHQQAPLHQATIQQGKIRCPWHGMCFDLESGATQDGCSQGLQFFPITYHEASIGVDT